MEKKRIPNFCSFFSFDIHLFICAQFGEMGGI